MDIAWVTYITYIKKNAGLFIRPLVKCHVHIAGNGQRYIIVDCLVPKPRTVI
jgi:hypothetical protein